MPSTVPDQRSNCKPGRRSIRESRDTRGPSVPCHARRKACEYRCSRPCDLSPRSSSPRQTLFTRGRHCPYPFHQIGALLEPLFPLERGVRLLGVSLSSLAEESEREPEFSLPV